MKVWNQNPAAMSDDLLAELHGLLMADFDGGGYTANEKAIIAEFQTRSAR